MIICHLRNYEVDAKKDFYEFTREKCEDIKYVDSARHLIVTDDGNEHWFMGAHKYFQWCKGRTYMTAEGTWMHSGYPIKKEGK